MARLPLLDLPEYLSQRVEEGELSPTNALLISRAPEELHDSLISEGGKLSKQKLRELIKRSTNEEAPQPDTQTQPTDLQKRFKSALRKVDKTDAWNNPQKSQQLEKLLQQIEKLLS